MSTKPGELHAFKKNVLVESIDQLLDSLDRFMDAPEYWRPAVGGHPRYFVHSQDGKKYLFGLSKYCAFKDIELSRYVSSEIRYSMGGTATRNHISKIAGKTWTPFVAADPIIQEAFEKWFFDFFPKTYDLNNIHFISLKNKDNTIPKKRTKEISPDQLREKLAQQIEIGEVGELIAMTYERERLSKMNVKEPSLWVDQVSKRNASAGFDILSNPPKREMRYIEVKSSTTTNESFYITHNEITILQQHKEQAFIYIVHITDLKKKQGQVVREVQDPIDKLNSNGDLEPVLFKAQFRD